MKSFDTDLKKYSEKIRLKVAERRELRERILSYMEYHPLPKRNEVLQVVPAKPGSFFVVHFNSLYTRASAVMLALFVLIGIPIVAEHSVPGDTLYLVKTQVNEGLRSQLANSPYEKVTFETKLIERRIAEARLLASEGKLTTEVQAQIAETVKGHADAAQNGLAEMRATNVDEAAVAEIVFDSALEVQSAVLDTNTSDSATSSTNGIRDVVNTVREEVVQNRGTTTPSYEGMLATIEGETTRAYELFETVKKSATSEEIADIERRLADIDRLISGAEGKHESKDETAVADLVDALGFIQKLIVFMTDIDVREAIELETIVPLVPTIEERTNTVRETIQEILIVEDTVNERLMSITDPNILEKATLGRQQLDELVGVATSSLAAGNIEAAETNTHEALALVNDLDQMTISTVVDEADPIIGDDGVLDAIDTGTSTDATTSTSTPGVSSGGTTTVDLGRIEAVE